MLCRVDMHAVVHFKVGLELFLKVLLFVVGLSKFVHGIHDVFFKRIFVACGMHIFVRDLVKEG